MAGETGGIADWLASLFGNNSGSGGYQSGTGMGQDGVLGGAGIMLDTGTGGTGQGTGSLLDFSSLGGLSKTNGTGLGFNTQTGQLALGGLSALGSLWGANNANKLANKQFNFTKDVTNTNLNNQVQSYNTALEDKVTARAAMQGQDSAYVSDYLNKNRLSR